MARTEARGDLDLNIIKWQTGLKRAEGQLRAFQSGATRYAVVSLTVGALGLREATKTIANFEQEISRVKALTGATATVFDDLRERALELGKSTKFSASEAASGMAFLAQAGFDANQIIRDSKTFLDLAVAGHLDLARAMDIASNVLQPFAANGVTAAQVADTLANTAASSNTNVEQLGEAMKQAAPVAAQMGQDIEMAAAAIGLLGNAGIQGEAAGTALRNVFLRLINPSAEVLTGIQALGLSVKELSPASNDLITILTRLKAGMDEVGDTQKAAAAAAQIFGVRAAAAGIILTNYTDQLRTLTAANEEAKGKAEEIADVMQDNLAGSLKTLASRIEAATLAGGEGGLTGTLRKLADEAVAAIDRMNETGQSAEFGRFMGEQLEAAASAAVELGRSVKDLLPLITETARFFAENADTLVKLWVAMKAIQFGQFIGSLVISAAAMVKHTAAIVANTGALWGNAAAAAAAAKAQQGLSLSALMLPAGNAYKKDVIGKATQLGGLFARGFALAAGAAFAGHQIGKWLDDAFDISDAGSDMLVSLGQALGMVEREIERHGDIREEMGNKRRAKELEAEKLHAQRTMEFQEQIRAAAEKRLAEKSARENSLEKQKRQQEEINRLVALMGDSYEHSLKAATELSRVARETAKLGEEELQANRDAYAATVRLLEAQAGVSDESAEQVEKFQEIRSLAIQIAETQQIGAERALALATREVELRRQALQAEEEAEKLRQRNEKRQDRSREIMDEVARLQAQLTDTLDDDRAVRRAQEIRDLMEDGLFSQEEAARLVDQKIRAEEAIERKRHNEAKMRFQDRLKMLRAEAGEGPHKVDDLKRAERLREIYEEIRETQGAGMKDALNAAREILRLEEKIAKKNERGGGIRVSKKAAESAIGRSYIENARRSDAVGRAVNSLRHSLIRSGQLAGSGPGGARGPLKATTQNANSDPRVNRGIDSGPGFSPLQAIVKNTKATASNTGSMLEQMQALVANIGVV